LFSKHLEGEIGPALCEQMERHVAACKHCHAACEVAQTHARTLPGRANGRRPARRPGSREASGARTQVPGALNFRRNEVITPSISAAGSSATRRTSPESRAT
jgi:hypothetical protein